MEMMRTCLLAFWLLAAPASAGRVFSQQMCAPGGLAAAGCITLSYDVCNTHLEIYGDSLPTEVDISIQDYAGTTLTRCVDLDTDQLDQVGSYFGSASAILQAIQAMAPLEPQICVAVSDIAVVNGESASLRVNLVLHAKKKLGGIVTVPDVPVPGMDRSIELGGVCSAFSDTPSDCKGVCGYCGATSTCVLGNSAGPYCGTCPGQYSWQALAPAPAPAPNPPPPPGQNPDVYWSFDKADSTCSDTELMSFRTQLDTCTGFQWPGQEWKYYKVTGSPENYIWKYYDSNSDCSSTPKTTISAADSACVHWNDMSIHGHDDYYMTMGTQPSTAYHSYSCMNGVCTEAEATASHDKVYMGLTRDKATCTDKPEVVYETQLNTCTCFGHGNRCRGFFRIVQDNGAWTFVNYGADSECRNAIQSFGSGGDCIGPLKLTPQQDVYMTIGPKPLEAYNAAYKCTDGVCSDTNGSNGSNGDTQHGKKHSGKGDGGGGGGGPGLGVVLVVVVCVIAIAVAAFVYYRKKKRYAGDQVVMGQIVMGSGAYDPAPVQQAVVINSSDSDTAPMVIVKGDPVP